MHNELSILLRVVIAGVLAGAIGYERERAGKSAGLRTHMLVGMSSALFVGVGELAVLNFPSVQTGLGDVGLRYDPIRVIQAIVIGIGFLGGGIIFVDRDHTRTVGLTTAAAVWGTAGIGLTVGLGLYIAAVGSTLLFIIVLTFLSRFDKGDDS